MDYVKYIRSLVGNNKIIMNAGAVIITNETNEILLQKRGDDFTWGLPGGIMEMGETLEETAIREAFEETGLHVKIEYPIGVFHYFDKVWPGGDQAHIVCHVYKAQVVSGKLVIDGEETLDLSYFTYPELPNIKAPDHLEAIHKYFGSINE